MKNSRKPVPSIGRLILRSGVFLLLFTQCVSHAIAQSDAIRSTFASLDVNGDSKLSFEESGQSKEIFDQVDADKNNFATLAEVVAHLRAGRRLSKRASPTSDPTESVGSIHDGMPVSLKSCRKAGQYSKRADGHAMLVMVDGDVVYERYDNGWDSKTPHRLASGTKSFAGVVAAIAVADGLLDWDEKVCDTITEWKEDPQRSQITIRQLLSLTSGIEPGDNGNVPTYAKAINAMALHPPGSKFQYGPNPFQTFGELMKRKLAASESSYRKYLSDKVLNPIGMNVGLWRTDSEGDPNIPSGLFLTAREWSKFGQLLCNRGMWGDEQLVRKDCLDQIYAGTKANPRYGITFWLAVKGASDTNQTQSSTEPTHSKTLPGDLVMACGAGKQRLYVLPEMKLVVVRFGETQGRRFQDDVYLKHLIVNKESKDQ